MKKRMTIKTTVFISLIGLSLSSSAQTVDYKIVGNDVTDLSSLKIRPSVSFFIPPTDLVNGLPTTVNIEAQKWTELIDFRALASYGSFNGLSIGGTYHVVNKVMTKKDKFVVSKSKTGNTETTTYFKAPVNIHRISGPCVDLTNGFLKDAGFFTKIDFGWDIQTYGRAYAEYGNRTLSGSRNGWTSVKMQGVLANVAIDMTDYFQLGAGTGKYTEERKMAIGAQASLSAAIRPWKRVTFYTSLPLGYVKYLGVSNAPSTTSKGAPILSINLGVQVGI
jgi:hypothetical protein